MSNYINSYWLEREDVEAANEKIGGSEAMPFVGEDRRGYVARDEKTARIAGVMVVGMAGDGMLGQPEVLYVHVGDGDLSDESGNGLPDGVMASFEHEVGTIAEAYGLKPESIRWPIGEVVSIDSQQ